MTSVPSINITGLSKPVQKQEMQNPNEESPIKKKLRARKEASQMHAPEPVGKIVTKDCILKPTEAVEKHLEVLKANAGINYTDTYYSESQKKIETFMGDKPKNQQEIDEKSSPTKENVGQKESMLLKQISPFAEKNRSRGNLKSPGPKAGAYVNELIKPDQQLITKLITEERDERYHYLIRNGTVAYVEADTFTIFVELPQIPHVLIAYRRPGERIKAKKQFNLSRKKLSAVPLFEGEEMLESLDLCQNSIAKIENLVSLPKLLNLNLSYNKINQMTNMNTLQGLKTLNLSHNCVSIIEGMDYLKVLETLDLECNLIAKISGLSHLPKIKNLNLSENMIESLDGLEVVTSLKDLKIRKNHVSF
jgi:Leucine-rich repeat (LRR) protein